MPAVCSICDMRKKQMTPVTWCSDCGEALCRSCEEHHSLSQSSKDHATIPYKDYDQLPSIIVSTSSKCSNHQESLTDFCRVHDKAICKSCIKASHRKCSDIPTINEIVQNVKTSVLFENVMSEVEHMSKLLSKTVETRKANIKEIDVMRQTMHKALEHEFDQIVKRLKQAKQNTASQIDKVTKQEKEIIADDLQTVESKATIFTDILGQQENIKQFSSNFQCFIGLKKIEEMILDSKKYLKTLSNDSKLDDTNISLEIHETFREIIGSVESFGKLKVDKTPSSVRIDNEKVREAQKEVQRTTDIKLQLQQTIELDKDGIYKGCCTLPNGMMVFPDYINDQLYIHNSDGSQKSTIDFTNKELVCDVTVVDDNHFAVSHPKSETISIINTNNNKIIKTLKTKHQTSGISHDKGSICFCVDGKGIMRVSVESGRVDNVVSDEDVSFDSRVSVGYDRVCYTCPRTSTVTVLDSQFILLFKFNDESLLDYPTGVTIDSDRNVYVTVYNPNNLVVISSDGKTWHQLLGSDAGLDCPIAVHFDSKTKQFLILNYFSGQAFQYAIK